MSNPPVDTQLSVYPDVLSVDLTVFSEGISHANTQAKQTAESMYCVVMPFAGRTLLSWLSAEYAIGQGHAQISAAQISSSSSKTLTTGSTFDVRTLFLQILEAVEYLHDNGQ